MSERTDKPALTVEMIAEWLERQAVEWIDVAADSVWSDTTRRKARYYAEEDRRIATIIKEGDLP